MPLRHFGSRALLLTVIALGSLVPGLAARQNQQPVAHFTGVLVNMLSSSPGAGTLPVTFVVNRWSTRAEEQRVLTTLLEQGPKALLETMRDLPAVASIAPVGSVGMEVRYAAVDERPDGSQRITMLTDRQMSFAERWYAGRTTDYPFTYIELRVGPNGEGAGTIQAAAQISIDKFNKTLVIENYNDQPIQVRSLRRSQ
jgi:hypothetical protein